MIIVISIIICLTGLTPSRLASQGLSKQPMPGTAYVGHKVYGCWLSSCRAMPLNNRHDQMCLRGIPPPPTHTHTFMDDDATLNVECSIQGMPGFLLTRQSTLPTACYYAD
jgi:hypothetical protein